ncbi:MAG: hypothetical protein KJ795_09065 [Gammaproteobacteria bacterium]|nr:hypothetical protein [Gammaproteobacteria bacterium]MBU1775298.1 hypothetical protein [Gammaproteobacteria bacterium]MBU1970140.1 hypothetical protein [Gammaproteobacteria bacterium]
MNDRIRQLLLQIDSLQDELNAAIREQGGRLRYQIEGRRVVFEQVISETHQRVRLGLFRWFLTVRPQNYLTMPVIYGMALPMLALDLCVSLYQWICFPVYGIARVKRSDYFVLDHQHLAYLNIIEKGHCLYCSYAVGLLAFASEVTARTEQYFCPIKHAVRVLGAHARYKDFMEYGESEDFHARLEAYRMQLGKEKSGPESPQCGMPPR